jgi:phenylalanyl-tRNA synthetase beta chain
MIASIQETAGPLLESVDLFDTYTGDRIGFGMKSLAYSLVFRSEKGTLKDNEVDTVIALIVKRVTRDHAAQLRA